MSSRTSVKEIMRERMRASPGCLDGTLRNARGEPFVQAVHGDDPLAEGFDTCAGLRPPAQAPPITWIDVLDYVCLAVMVLGALNAMWHVPRLRKFMP